MAGESENRATYTGWRVCCTIFSLNVLAEASMSIEANDSSFRFSLKSLLLVLVFIGLILGWWLEQSRLTRALRDEKRRFQAISFVANRMLFEQFERVPPKGHAAAEYPLEALASKKFDSADWERGSGDLWPMRDDEPLQMNPIPPGGRFVGYVFEMEDDGEGGPSRYFVVTRNEIIVEIAITPPSLD
jgi:hypothetical protein